MMEVVKSCFYYHEQLKVARRRGALVFGSTTLVDCLPGMPEKLIQHHQHQRQRHHQEALNDHPLQELQQQQHFVAADVRIALFSRLCELVPFDVGGPAVDSAALVEICRLSGECVVDVLGDILELDPYVSSLAAVEEVPTEENWGFHAILEDTEAWIARLAPVLRSDAIEGTIPTDCIAVDVFLALFATTWMRYDQRLEGKLHAKAAFDNTSYDNIEASQHGNEA
ncbi:hypothetical protein GQ600_14741 [Phytophthora cactorum]|nr:hypothetical protein GQ600_14741 [Phytophthora cactorum]